MTISKRERMIGIALGAVLALFAIDRYALSPFLEQRDQLAMQNQTVTKKLQDAVRLLGNRKRVDKAWHELTGGGLKNSAAEAESQTLHALRDWAQAARIDLDSLKPDRVVQSGDFQQIRFEVTGNGPVAGMARMLWSIETSDLPLQLGELHLAARKEGTDDLAMQLSVTALVFAPQPAPKIMHHAPVKEETE